MMSPYWKRRSGLDELYADTLKNMAARLGCGTVRQMNKGQLADFIIRNEEATGKTQYVNDCIAAGKDGYGKFLYLGD